MDLSSKDKVRIHAPGVGGPNCQGSLRQRKLALVIDPLPAAMAHLRAKRG